MDVISLDKFSPRLILNFRRLSGASMKNSNFFRLALFSLLATTTAANVHSATISWNNYQIFNITPTPNYRWGPLGPTSAKLDGPPTAVPNDDQLKSSIDLTFTLTAKEVAAAAGQGIGHTETHWLWWQEDETLGDTTIVRSRYSINFDVPSNAAAGFAKTVTVVPPWQATRFTFAQTVINDNPDFVIEIDSGRTFTTNADTREIEFAEGPNFNGANGNIPGSSNGVSFPAANAAQTFLAQAGTSVRVYAFDATSIYGFNPTSHELRALFDASITHVDGTTETSTEFNSLAGIVALAPNQPTIGQFTLASSDLIPALLSGSFSEPVGGFSQTSLIGLNLPGDGATSPLSSMNHQPGTEALWLHFGNEQQYGFLLVVAEPEIYAMFLAGFGLIGVIARRRKQNS